MDLLGSLAFGFSVALTPENILYCFVGALLGTLIGVLPGIGPVATIAMLLPVTYGLQPVTALIMLAGVYYGAQYGGSITSILVNLPGEVTSVVTCLDGYQMARQGRAGAALAVAALGSFFAGCIGTLCLAAFAWPLSNFALEFGAAEYFSLITLGLVGSVALANGPLLKAVAMTVLGLVLGLVGTDVNTGLQRFTFGLPEFADGIGTAVLAVGVFGLGEIIASLERDNARQGVETRYGSLWVTKAEFRLAAPAVLRGTGLGTILGLLPGGGALLASFAAYALEKRMSRSPERFGRGAIEGVAAPESANNAAAQTGFVPLLTLGIPPNAIMALLVGALTIHGIQPGPHVIGSNPALFWGVVASMWIGNLMLVILNLPAIGLWVKLLNTPSRLLYPAITVFGCIGIYSLSSNAVDVYMMATFGLIGYVFVKLDCELAPMILGFVLGPMMEENLRRALLLSRGDPSVFVTQPISLLLLLAATGLLLISSVPAIHRHRSKVIAED